MSVLNRNRSAPAEPVATVPRQSPEAPIALLIAGVGASLLTTMVGATRITQLRRRLRKHH